ncbi:MAG: transcription elongation factor GreB [Clostridia bacterium]|nr:transcription elongation factor GreB [Deltaproteobacteria bacterium]
MSKAFTKEPDEEVDEDFAAEEERAKNVGNQYITPAGFRVLSDELDKLWRVERPRVAKEVEVAAAMGDRSENAEYIYGKRRLREIDRRLRYLKKRMEHVTVVTASPDQQDRVFFGALVTCEDEDGVTFVYRLVGADEIETAKRWISLDSPIGKALLGKREGDVVTVQRPKGEVELTVMAITY